MTTILKCLFYEKGSDIVRSSDGWKLDETLLCRMLPNVCDSKVVWFVSQAPSVNYIEIPNIHQRMIVHDFTMSVTFLSPDPTITIFHLSIYKDSKYGQLLEPFYYQQHLSFIPFLFDVRYRSNLRRQSLMICRLYPTKGEEEEEEVKGQD